MTSELLQKEKVKVSAVLPESVVRYIEDCAGKSHPNSYLISVLHKVQDHFGYLAKEHMDAVSVLMQIPSAKVTGVAGFYHFFKFTPPGKHRISLCMGTACFVKGAGHVLDKLKDLLGIDVGQTTPDAQFSIDVARCVGACALAPVMIVDEKVYAGVKPDQVGKILAGYGFKRK
ncbi:MAG: NAD(P)H-dependent oxidoreductase subunit E [bacterium]